MQIVVACQQSQTEDRCTFEIIRRARWLLAALTLPATTEEALASVVVADACDAPAEPAPNGPREQMPTVTTSRCVAALSRVELLLIDQGGMDAGIPLARVLHLAEIGTIEADEAHGRVFHVDAVGDLLETAALGAKREDALDNRRLIVRYEFAVHHGVASRRVILPTPALGRLALTHLRVLHDLIAVVLSKDAIHSNLDLARCAREIEFTFVHGTGCAPSPSVLGTMVLSGGALCHRASVTNNPFTSLGFNE